MSTTKPNLLFIMTDHQRADSLGRVQAGVEVTPNLNALAAESATFRRAYTTCPLCAPARTALATGVYPTANGIVFNDFKGARAGNFKPIHQCLFEAGYAVGHVGVDHIRVRPPLQRRLTFAAWASWADHQRSLDERGIGWKRHEAGKAYKTKVMENRRGRRAPAWYSNAVTSVWPLDPERFPDFWFARQAERFCLTRSGPFALFLYLWAPHPPLWVPGPYASLFDPDRLDLPANVGAPADGEPASRRRGVAAQLAEGVSIQQWRRVWAAHLGLVRLADAAVGRVLAALDRAGQARNTVIAFTADHGDHLGQHAMYQKMEMYEPALRVPLLIRLPGAPPGRFDAPVSHLDVLPTILEALALPAPPRLDGTSLARAILAGAAPAGRPVFACYSGNPAIGDIRRAVVTDQYKYVYDPEDDAELYDLAADPLETANLAGDPARADAVSRLHARCAQWHRQHGDWVDFGPA